MQTPSFQRLLAIPKSGRRITALTLAVLGLSAVYLFQQFNYMGYFFGSIGDQLHPYTVFVFNKTFRYLLNDTLSILMIYGLFYKKSYTMIGFYLELIGLVILLPLYFSLKLSFEGDTELSSPMLSFFHRLIINPTLMILLIMGLFYQQKTAK